MRHRFSVVPLALPAILFAALAAPANADTWAVTNGSSDATTPACDTTAHTCLSLRTAIAASEATKGVADVINVPAGTININNDLVVQSDITINGVSARSNFIDGGLKYRGLRVTAAGDAKLNHFTIRNGAGGGGGIAQGGGVVNQGIAALDHVRVTNSSAGGVANLTGGRLALVHSLIDTNAGGGVLNVGGAEVTPITWTQIVDSTIFDNTGAIGAPGGVVSTNQGLLTVLRSTVADNTGGQRSSVGGLLVPVAANSQVIGSIVARNHSATGATVNCGPTPPTDGGANIADDGSCGFSFGGDPGLDTSLVNAGGETDVLAIAATSPAVDRVPTGDNCPAGTRDQRDQARPAGAACDSGAYEYVPPPVEPTPTATPQPTVSPTPSPSPTATPTPTPSATPVAGRSVAAVPVAGTVLVKLPGAKTFKKLDPSVISNGSEVDTRNGTVEITRSDGGKARFYAGLFKLSQSGGITTLTLTEKLTGCPASAKRASAAATKPKTRKLWGDGKGRFRTKGQYSAATVRGTRWLVQDGCRYTRTAVAEGVVSVRDDVRKKSITLRKGKTYTARPRR